MNLHEYTHTVPFDEETINYCRVVKHALRAEEISMCAMFLLDAAKKTDQ